MVALVTLDEARRHLNLTEQDMDEDTFLDVTLKVAIASDLVVDYLKRPNHVWDEETAPGVVKAAVLLTLAALFDDRETATISEPVRALLVRLRDPACA